jgi:hypothetical protein
MPSVAIETPYGVLYGRDTIFLDSMDVSQGMNVVELRGELNVAASADERDQPYIFRFTGVMALQWVELDSWEGEGVSSFDEVLDSPWIAALGGKVDPSRHRHFHIQTYDEGFEIVCGGMTCEYPDARADQ